MTKHVKFPPPMAHITPEQARKSLGPSVTSHYFSAFSKRAQTAVNAPAARPIRIPMWELCRYVFHMPRGALRQWLVQNPHLPQGAIAADGLLYFSLADVETLRHALIESAMIDPPYRPAAARPLGVSVTNLKGGVGKTTTTAHLAMAAALDGYRVLVVDLDPQASLTRMFGAKIENEWQTAFPLIARHHALALKAAKLSLDPLHDDAETADFIQPTAWPNIDLCGAHPNLAWAEVELSLWRHQTPHWPLWSALADGLKSDDLLGRYDIIFFDTPPSMGYLTINALAASDILLIPLGLSALELHSTVQVFETLHTIFSSIEASGNPGFQWHAVEVILTRMTTQKPQDAALYNQILRIFDPILAPRSHYLTAHRTGQTDQPTGLYALDRQTVNRRTFCREREKMDDAYLAFKRLLTGVWCKLEPHKNAR